MSLLVSAESIGFGRYGHWVQVRHGEVTNEWCGRYFGVEGCLEAEKHEGIHHVNGKDVDTTNVGEFHIVHRHCGHALCPKCGGAWVYEEANKASLRLEEASKGLGKIEHVVLSLPVARWGEVLTLEGYRKVRAEGVKVLYDRGFNGFGLTFHPFRHGVFKPHWHALAACDGGYRCRSCAHTKDMCMECSGVHGRQMRGYAVDGWIVRVLGERRSVLATIKYELGHAGGFDGVKGFRIITWHGTMGHRKLHVVYKKNRVHCSICDSEFHMVKDLMSRALITDVTNPSFKREFFSMIFNGFGEACWEYADTSPIVPFSRDNG